MSGFPRWCSGNEFTFQCRRLKRCKRCGFNTCCEDPLRRKWQPTPVVLPENSMYRGAWQATVHRTAKSRTQLRTHITLHYICMSLLHLGERTLNLDSVNPFFSFLLPGSQMWQQSSFNLADEYNDLIGREQQYARELHP